MLKSRKTTTRNGARAAKPNGKNGAAKRRPVRRNSERSAAAFDAEKFITTIGAGRTVATYKPKSFIFRQGAKCDAIFYIQQGQVQLTVVSQQGKERVVGILGPETFIGERITRLAPLTLRPRALDGMYVRLEATMR